MKSTPTATKPLRGIRVLVGRARHQAGALSRELRKLGADVLEIPFIEIRRPRSYRPLDSALRRLSEYDWLILTSVNGVEAMWERMEKVVSELPWKLPWKSGSLEPRTRASRALAPVLQWPRIAAIGPATRKALEERGAKVDIVPREYVAESVVSALQDQVKGKRVLLVRAKVARDVIPRELRKAGARVDVVEAYETVVPQSSRQKLQAALRDPRKRPQVVTFTSSSTVRNFVELVGAPNGTTYRRSSSGRGRPRYTLLDGIQFASIGPVTSSTLREIGLRVDIEAKEFTIPGLLRAIADAKLPHKESAT